MAVQRGSTEKPSGGLLPDTPPASEACGVVILGALDHFRDHLQRGGPRSDMGDL